MKPPDTCLAYRLETEARTLDNTPSLSLPIRQHPERDGNSQALGPEFPRRNGAIAATVNVSVSGSKVILKGSVQSWAQYEDLERHAWSAPGISDVENQLTVDRSLPPGE
jgi:hypothetical protein